jgi:hypothetical protein
MKHKFNLSASTCVAELVLEGDYTDDELELVLEGDYTDDELTDTQRLLLDNMTRVTETEDN